MVDSYLLYTQKLEGKYRETFDKVDMYVSAKQMRESTKEEMMSNLLDIFLSAQEEERPIETVTGKNVEQFCKELCSGYGLKEQLLSFLESVRGWVCLLFILSSLDMAIFVLEFLEGADVNLLTYKTEFNIATYGTFLLAVGFMDILTGFIVRRIMFRGKRLMRRLLIAIRIVAVTIPVIAFLVYIDKVKGALLPTWICFVVSGLLLTLYKIATKKERSREETIRFSDYCKLQENEDYFIDVERKNFLKRNEKLVKRGQKPLTKEGYIKLEMEKMQRRNSPIYYILLPLGIVAITGGWMWCTNQFESAVDVGVYLAFMLIIEGLFMRAAYRFTKKSDEERSARLEQELLNPVAWKE